MKKILNMKKILIVSALGSLTSHCIAQESNTVSQPRSPDQVSIFQMPLRCPAAPQIGCGSSAKPILLELEREPEISEAWLNRAGTLIAVVWKSNAKAEPLLAKLQSQASAAGCCASGITVAELKGNARDTPLKEFDSGGWYRGEDVDRLSEEEAGVIAARVVRRLQAKAPLAAEKAQGLEQALKKVFGKWLINGGGRENCEPEIHKVATKFLDERQTAALSEAIESGYRPGPDEK